ncbi:hypothetical protein [Peribacillus frigoritolerans]|uniref:hypothetical protein n=1 Tax=Peribacillus frigoritolerans TaxID=450367 RepID=UPI00105A6AE7|nr:hypothetical protein [Peribacillus frigoritolerans]TDL82085.1 hypothetical protein E2R53_00395 [Peribacillus frigoritolerans]
MDQENLYAFGLPIKKDDLFLCRDGSQYLITDIDVLKEMVCYINNPDQHKDLSKAKKYWMTYNLFDGEFIIKRIEK